jgi:cobalt-zinc-cadmium efflux system protein
VPTELSAGHVHGGPAHGHARVHAHRPDAHAADWAANKRSLGIALGLNAAYTAIEGLAGFLTGSLALLADAGHNLSDVFALGLALGAVWLAGRPPTPRRSFGFKRAEILAALANALLIVAIAVLIFVEAARRFANPTEVHGGWLIAVATVGLVINLVGAALVFRRGGQDLNMRASFLHLAGDALGSLGVIAAGGIILATGWQLADPLFSVLIGLLLLATCWTVIRDSVLVLLEAAPRGMDVNEIGTRMSAFEGVVEVHDLHVWEITSGFPALSAHVLVRPEDDCHAIRRGLERLLHERFEIDHTTLQVDHRDEPRLLQIGGFTQPGERGGHER